MLSDGSSLPPALPGTALRILATTDLGAATVPYRTSWGESGTPAGVVALLDVAPQLPFPLLCANADIGSPPATVLDTHGGPLA